MFIVYIDRTGHHRYKRNESQHK